MLEDITTLGIFHFFLIFTRLGTAMIAMPGFGEIYVSPSTRLATAAMIALVLTPVLAPILPPIPGEVGVLVLMLAAEALTGIFIGGLMRLLQATLHIAGMIIAFQSSLASALLFDANQGSQGSVVGNFMTLVGITLLFTTNLHHIMLAGVVESYQLFQAAKMPPVADFAQFASQTLAAGFKVAVKIASPLIVIGLLLYLGAGLMGRLMPNMQVFFVIIPLQIYINFAMMALSLTAGMLWYLTFYEETIRVFFSGS